MWVWGIDTGSHRCGFGFIEISTGRCQPNAVEWRHPRKTKGDARSLLACHQAVSAFTRAALEHFPPAAIVYEAPTGRVPNPVLVMHAGVIVQAVMAQAPVAPFPIAVSSWKGAVLGSGNAPSELLRPWAAGLGLPDAAVEDLDGLAALAVATTIAGNDFGVDLVRLVSASRG